MKAQATRDLSELLVGERKFQHGDRVKKINGSKKLKGGVGIPLESIGHITGIDYYGAEYYYLVKYDNLPIMREPESYLEFV